MQKEVDFLVRGGDVISLCFAMNLLRERQEVLFYNELESNERGPQNQNFWGSIELKILELLGHKLNSDVLKNVKKYTKPVQIEFRSDTRRLLFGENPWENFHQIYQQFPIWFDCSKSPSFDPRAILKPSFEEEFNREFFAAINRIVENCFRYRNLENLTASLFETHSPDFINNIQHSLSQFLRQETTSKADLKGAFKSPFKNAFQNTSQNSIDQFQMNLEQRQCLLGLRFLFQGHLNLKWGKVEVFHFLMSMLSPRFELDEKLLFEDLKKEFQKFGGQWLSSETGEKVVSKEPIFDKVKYSIAGESQKYSSDYCFSFINSMTKLGTSFKSSALEFRDSPNALLSQLVGEVAYKNLHPLIQTQLQSSTEFKKWIFIMDPSKLAGDLGIWLYFLKGNEKKDLKNCKAQILTWVRETSCLDSKWFEKKAFRELENQGMFASNFQSEVENMNLKPTGGLGFINDFTPGASSFEAQLPKRLPLYFGTENGVKIKPKRGKYYGRKRGPSMGIFDQLLEVKDVSYWAEKR